MADRPPRTDNIPAPETETRTLSELFDDKAPKYPAQRTPGDRAFEKEWGFNVKPVTSQQAVGDAKFDPKRIDDGASSRMFPGGTRVDWDAVSDVIQPTPGPMATSRTAGMGGTRPVQAPPQRAMTPDELSAQADRMMAQIRAQSAVAGPTGGYVGQLQGLDRQAPPPWLDDYMAKQKKKP